MMSIFGQKLPEMDKLTVLQFDEMKIRNEFEYDKKNDSVHGPCDQMQVILARGLTSKWKQPVYVDFDDKMTKFTLKNVVNRLAEAGFTVVAIVSDNGGSNIGLRTNLCVSEENPFFELNQTKIHVFSDVPHLLKLIRNWILDYGFIMSDGSVVSKIPLIKLISLHTTEVSSLYDLGEKHLSCKGVERQNVRLAEQLLSFKTATALKQYFPEDPVALSTAEFIMKVSKWYDVMNTYVCYSAKQTKKAYGLDIENQNNILDDFFVTISTMSVKKTDYSVWKTESTRAFPKRNFTLN